MQTAGSCETSDPTNCKENNIAGSAECCFWFLRFPKKTKRIGRILEDIGGQLMTPRTTLLHRSDHLHQYHTHYQQQVIVTEMTPETEFQLRRLVLTTTTFTLCASVFVICGLRAAPSDPFSMRTSLTAYSFLFAILSIIGFLAALKRHATLITVFACHLLLDSVLLFIPRILLIQFSTSIPSMLCSSATFPDEDPAKSSVSVATTDGRAYFLHNLGDFASPAWNKGSCTVWTWGLEVAFVGLLVLHMAMQVVLCLRLFRYASWLGSKTRWYRIRTTKEQLV